MEMREVALDGRPVRWRAAGSGPPLVCLHGLSGSWRWWLPVLPALAERHEVHLVDLPRFTALARFRPGDAAAWLERWLDAAALERPVLVGHSLGGLLSAQLAARRPGALDRLVLVDPAGVPVGWGYPREVLALAGALRATLPRFLPLLGRDALRTGPESLWRGLRYAVETDLTVELARIDVPTLIVWGGRDTLVPVRLAEIWRASIASARLVVLSGAGHVPMFDAPDELTGAVLAFLDGEA